jgi:hypothetical protein
MARVECEKEECELQNDRGITVTGVRVTCGKCGHVTESFGTEYRSVKRCLAMLRDECPEDETNYYFIEGEDES